MHPNWAYFFCWVYHIHLISPNYLHMAIFIGKMIMNPNFQTKPLPQPQCSCEHTVVPAFRLPMHRLRPASISNKVLCLGLDWIYNPRTTRGENMISYSYILCIICIVTPRDIEHLILAILAGI